MKKNQTVCSRRSFMVSLAGVGSGATLSPESVAQEPSPDDEYSGPLVSTKNQWYAQNKPVKIETSKPNGFNIIVLIADTFRWDYCYFNGINQRIHTPNLDKLAEEGVYFENCYANGLPTIPARRVIHTGKSILPEENKWHPLNKKERIFTPYDDVTFAEILGIAGFNSGFMVDTYHHFKPGMNFHQHFNQWEFIRGQESDPYRTGPRNSVNPEEHCPKHLLNDGYRESIIQYLLNTQDRKSEDDYFCARTCLAGMKFLNDNKDCGKPIMLFIDMFDPHEPWDAPPRFQKMYREKYPFERYIFGYGVNTNNVTEDDYPILRDLYSADVTHVDHCIGQVIDEVKRLGMWDNTIIVFSTDHGTHLGEQGCIQKQQKLLNSLYTRVPLIIRHPDRAYRGKRINGLTSHVDFVPTFISLLGIQTNLDFDGYDMWELVDGKKEKLRDYVASGHKDNFGSVKTHDWYYYQNVWGGDPGLGPQLYNLKEDPFEEKNVVQNYPEVVAEMKRYLEISFKRKVS